MSYDFYSTGSRSGALDTALGDFLPRLLNVAGLRGLGALGGGLFAIFAAQWAAGALLGAGVTWGSARATMTGEARLGAGSYAKRYFPNFTLGSTYFHANAGDVLHVHVDADIRAGELSVHLWRIPGMDGLEVARLQRSGDSEYDVKIPKTGFYDVLFSAWDARSGAAVRNATGTVATEDLSYRLDWRLTR